MEVPERSGLFVLARLQRSVSWASLVATYFQNFSSVTSLTNLHSQGSCLSCHGSSADGTGSAGKFVVADAGPKYRNGVNSGSGSVGERDTLGTAVATESPLTPGVVSNTAVATSPKFPLRKVSQQLSQQQRNTCKQQPGAWSLEPVTVTRIARAVKSLCKEALTCPEGQSAWAVAPCKK